MHSFRSIAFGRGATLVNQVVNGGDAPDESCELWIERLRFVVDESGAAGTMGGQGC